MAAKIVIELPGEPRGKQRPRYSRGRVYTPKQTRDYESALGWAAKLAMKAQSPLSGPLRVTVTAFVGIPESYTRQDRIKALGGEIWPRGDVDNFLKSACDALNGICYLDDNQIVWATGRKCFAIFPLTRVEIDSIGESKEKGPRHGVGVP